MSQKVISSIYAWVFDNDGFGVEGIPAGKHGGVILPLMTGDRRLAVAMKDDAQHMARVSGNRIELREFKFERVLDSIDVAT